MNHLLILPILLPAVVAPLLALAVRHDIVLARVFSLGATLALVAIGVTLVFLAGDDNIRIYELGNWSAPYGIVLVLDRLSAVMILLTACLAVIVQLYVIGGWDRRGQHFHSLFQVQLMGINGAFLTGDLFNLFVFFELLLIASYGLMVHGGGATRLRAGLQYVTINLVGSVFFLLGLGLLYGVTGTLNMADLAVKLGDVAEGDRALVAVGFLMLLVVFGLKAALVPLHFWLPGTYANAPPPVAALFAIMTKVGVYSMIRLNDLVLGPTAGPLVGVGTGWIVPAAMLTLAVGAIGVLAARSLSAQASFASLASMGTLLVAVGCFTPDTQAAGLYYLLHSTFAMAGLFLLIDLVIARRPGHGDGLRVPVDFAHRGFLAAIFFLMAMIVIGLPPWSGFLGKLQILESLRGIEGWPGLWALILGGSFLTLVGFAQSGSRVFWRPTGRAATESGNGPKAGEPTAPTDRDSTRPPSANRREETACPAGPADSPASLAMPMVAIGTAVLAILGLSVLPEAVMGYLDATTDQLFHPERYIEAVLKMNAGEGP